MQYKKFTPSESLRRFIECYYVWDAIPGRESLIVQSPPNGYMAMVFNYGDPYFLICDDEADGRKMPVCFLVGQQTSNYKLKLTGTTGMVGIVLKPTSFATLFDIDISTTANQRIDLQILLGDEIGTVLENIIHSKTADKRIQSMEAYLLTKLPGYRARLNVADLAAEKILLLKGNISVEELASDLCVSRRHLERTFLEKTGLSPKQYARIVRMSSISNFVAHHEKVDWQDLVYEGGFHDQNHFVKDFKKLNHESPAKYHQQHKELTRFITSSTK